VLGFFYLFLLFKEANPYLFLKKKELLDDMLPVVADNVSSINPDSGYPCGG